MVDIAEFSIETAETWFGELSDLTVTAARAQGNFWYRTTYSIYVQQDTPRRFLLQHFKSQPSKRLRVDKYKRRAESLPWFSFSSLYKICRDNGSAERFGGSGVHFYLVWLQSWRNDCRSSSSNHQPVWSPWRLYTRTLAITTKYSGYYSQEPRQLACNASIVVISCPDSHYVSMSFAFSARLSRREYYFTVL